MTAEKKPEPEFSYEIELGDLGKTGKVFRLSATEEQRARVAARLGTPSVEKLEGEMRVTSTKTAIRIEGSIDAALTRECVASLEPMQEEVSETFEIDFLRTPPDDADGEDWDAPDVHEGDSLDLGELLVQQLSLAMDPFPRKEGAKSLAEAYAPKENISPFAALQGVIGKDDDNQ